MAVTGTVIVDSTGTVGAFGAVVVVGDGGSGASGGGAIWSSAGITEVSNTGTETTLLGGGEGSLTLAANDWEVGDVLIGEFSGDWTQTGTASNVTITAKVGTGATISWTLIPIGSVDQEEWRCRVKFTRVTEGGSGTVLSEGELWASGTDATPALIGETTAVTVPSNAAQTLDLTCDWVTGHANNKWRRRQGEWYLRRAATG